MALALLGFQLGVKEQPEDSKKSKQFTLPQNDDGAVVIQAGAYYGTYVDLDGVVRNEIELVTRYREMSLQPELETAVDDIVNEAIVTDNSGQSIQLVTDNLAKVPESIKRKFVMSSITCSRCSTLATEAMRFSVHGTWMGGSIIMW